MDLLVSNGNGNGGRYLAVAGDLGSLAWLSASWSRRCTRRARKGLNGLVNNAGAAFASTKALSPDGYERTIAINHVAVAALRRRGCSTFCARELTTSHRPPES